MEGRKEGKKEGEQRALAGAPGADTGWRLEWEGRDEKAGLVPSFLPRLLQVLLIRVLH